MLSLFSSGRSRTHSIWEQDSLEAHSKLPFGCLDAEVEALQQRKAQYDEAMRSCQTGVTPAGATHAVTQAARQGSRWALDHCHWAVLWRRSHKSKRRREQLVNRLARGKGGMS